MTDSAKKKTFFVFSRRAGGGSVRFQSVPKLLKNVLTRLAFETDRKPLETGVSRRARVPQQAHRARSGLYNYMSERDPQHALIVVVEVSGRLLATATAAEYDDCGEVE